MKRIAEQAPDEALALFVRRFFVKKTAKFEPSPGVESFAEFGEERNLSSGIVKTPRKIGDLRGSKEEFFQSFQVDPSEQKKNERGANVTHVRSGVLCNFHPGRDFGG
ncbi:hypothetical protein RRG08_066274 [Elysia crispata]|uniref:Uncharacterized protein n=1 Tax=Elysia crispata TaxID=231223 RepID=A0AAE1E2W7_9GAST|nr:hypothetical protein RRG08_066274 [Elysia crispata]